MSFFTLKRTALASAALAALLSAGAAQANLGSGDLAVTATMAGGCEITNTVVDFGTIAGFFPVGQFVQREHMVRVHCSPGVGGQIGFGSDGSGGAHNDSVIISGNHVGTGARFGACPAGADFFLGAVTHPVNTSGLAQDIPICVRLTPSHLQGLPAGNFSFTMPVGIR